MNSNDDALMAKQIAREDASEALGQTNFNRSETKNNKINNASNNTFGIALIKARHESIINHIESITQKELGSKRNKIHDCLNNCIKLDHEGNSHELVNIEVWAFLGLQAVLDNTFNTNIKNEKQLGQHGGDKNLVARKSRSELELHVGKLINDQMSLELIKMTFPNWFRVHDKFSKKRSSDGLRATPSYYNKRMVRAINRFASKLDDKGDHDGAEFLRRRKPWLKDDCRIIGEVVVAAVLLANDDYLESVLKVAGKKKSYDIQLTLQGKAREKELKDYVAAYAHDLLPMLITPNPVTGESLGGWMNELLQEPEQSMKGEFIPSSKHLEFINRQARTKFEINPFIHDLLEKLVEEQKPLGKFIYEVPETVLKPSDFLGLSAIIDPEERNRRWDSITKKEQKEARLASFNAHEKQGVQSCHNRISLKLVDMVRQLADDECFYIPMKYCFRGRIYSRVPFLSFQGTDAGKYLLRFYQKTPCDDDTMHWLKIGVANAGGQDKKCWDDRLNWFNKHERDVINVGRMLTTGNFSAAYEFLNTDQIDDPFAFAALANEYVKIYIDKTQNYTQVFVLLDASCSGTSIFNGWRRNKQGALKTNLIDTPAPADIYMAVWYKIKELLPTGSIRKSFIDRLEKSKLLRKMMKSTYVPASYA